MAPPKRETILEKKRFEEEERIESDKEMEPPEGALLEAKVEREMITLLEEEI